jgi:L-cysteine:1D-myo-inositol 2-amino-2-deoxy-alpha-D-glucopyranoside ligase
VGIPWEAPGPGRLLTAQSVGPFPCSRSGSTCAASPRTTRRTSATPSSTLAFDVLIRYLEHLGHRVVYVRNVTDVDDDILRKAREIGVDYDVLARSERSRSSTRPRALGLRPDAEPWATETVPAIIVPMVRACWTRGQRVRAAGRPGVLRHRRAAPAFRLLSAPGPRRGCSSSSRRRAATRTRRASGRARLPAVAAQLPDEPGGTRRGCRPARLAHRVLGDGDGAPGLTIDIHGGGTDLCSPTTRRRSLQAEGLTGQGPFARFWMHVAMVALDEVKMSKSLGNLVFVLGPAGAVRAGESAATC